MQDFRQFLEFRRDVVEAEIKVINRYLKGEKPKKQKGTSKIIAGHTFRRTAPNTFSLMKNRVFVQALDRVNIDSGSSAETKILYSIREKNGG